MKQYAIKGLDVECGLKNVNNQEDIYDMVLETYCQEAVEKMAIYSQVDESFLQENLQKTIIDMHGIKGASNGIGALELGEQFRKMEFAGKDGDIAYLYENMKPCMDAYREMVEQINAARASEGSDLEVELSGEEMSIDEDLIDELVQALDDIDFDKFEETMDELMQQNFGPNTNRTLKEAWNFYDNFDYDEAADLLKQLKG